MRKIGMILLLNFVAFTLMADMKIFKGDSTYTRDCVVTFKDGKLYKGDSTYTRDCVVTYKDGKLYKGDSTYTRDCMLTFSERPSEALIAWMIFSFYRGMLW